MDKYDRLKEKIADIETHWLDFKEAILKICAEYKEGKNNEPK